MCSKALWSACYVLSGSIVDMAHTRSTCAIPLVKFLHLSWLPRTEQDYRLNGLAVAAAVHLRTRRCTVQCLALLLRSI